MPETPKDNDTAEALRAAAFATAAASESNRFASYAIALGLGVALMFSMSRVRRF